MFGYITVDPGALTPEAKERYQHWYCGLCQAMYRKVGQLGRAVLSNDMTFLAIVLSSVYEPDETEETRACPMHPLKKRGMHATGLTEYCADMNLLLAYYKCLDNVRDENKSSSRRMAKSLEKEVESIRRRYPEKDACIQDVLERIHQGEDADSQDVDAMCRLSGEMVAEVFCQREDIFAPLFRQIGYALGQFLYLCDAWEDYDEDLKKHRYNPLKCFHDQPGFEETVYDALSGMAGEALAAAHLLPVVRDQDLVENILLHGVFYRYNLCMQKKLRKSKDDSAKNTCDEKGAEDL